MKMNRVIAALLTIFIATVLVSAGTFAYFSDTETSTGNTFTAGTLDLKTYNPTITQWVDGVTATWTMSNMVPGVTTAAGAVDLRNFGSIAGDHLEIRCDYTVTEVWQEPDTEDTSLVPDNMAKYLEITKLRYENFGWYIDCLTGQQISYATGAVIATSEDWRVNDIDGVGGISLYDLKNDPLDNLPPPDGSHKVAMDLKFHADAGNNLQGDILHLTVYFTLNQHSSQ